MAAVTAMNQNEESLMSSTSYSDRDDGFNYGSMSENDEDSEKEERNKRNDDEENNENNDDNSSDSQSSARTAKTIREKCLIMGRIFKNANKTTRIEEKKQEPVVSEPPPKKKLEAQRQELDKLFDSLRKEPGTLEIPTSKATNGLNIAHTSNGNVRGIPEKVQSDITTTTETVTTNHKKQPIAAKKKPLKKTKMTTNQKVSKEENNIELNLKSDATKPNHNHNISSQPPEEDSVTMAAAETAVTKGRKRSRKSDAQQDSKEIYKLQTELGMSAEEIAELIGEGKRKSQRRCAANRPKKVVEIWSSDEYEDFLSTKDIIALIEEKEKKSKRRKSTASKSAERKKDVNQVLDTSQSTTAAATVTNITPLEKSTIEKSSKSTLKEMKNCSAAEKSPSQTVTNVPETECPPPKKSPEKIVDKLLEKLSQAKNDQDENKPLSQVVAETKCKLSKPTEVGALISNTSKKSKEKMQEKLENSLKERKSQKKPTLSVKPRVKSHPDDSESDFESEWRRGTFETKRAKIKKRRKTISFKESPAKKSSSNTKSTSTTAVSRAKSSSSSSAAPINNQKSSNNRNGGKVSQNNTGNKDGGDDDDRNDNETPSGIRPLPRRKRVASEMLYYWSSSSDEDFGRIETRDDDDDLTDGEHYQQHGWIVGDSHKKLVTLLAIAKGKKAEDCGVKETVSKKKS